MVCGIPPTTMICKKGGKIRLGLPGFVQSVILENDSAHLEVFMFRSITLLQKKFSGKSRWIAFFCLFSLVFYSFAGVLHYHDDFEDSDDCLIGKAVHTPWLHESQVVFSVIFCLLSSFAGCFLLIIPADYFISTKPSRAPPQLIF